MITPEKWRSSGHSGIVAASLLRMHTALPGKSVWAAVEILMEVTWESRSCRGSVALLGLGCSQGFSERPVKKVGMTSKKQDFQLVSVLPGGWKK